MILYTNKWTAIFSIFSLGVIGAIIAVLVFVFTQRPVNFISNNPEVQGGLILDPNGFNISATSSVNIVNENYFPLWLTNITATGTHPLYNGTIGTGTVLDTWINPNSQINFTFPFNFTYLRNLDQNKNYFNQVVDNCTDNLQLTVFLQTVASYSIYITSGQIQVASSIIQANCPNI